MKIYNDIANAKTPGDLLAALQRSIDHTESILARYAREADARREDDKAKLNLARIEQTEVEE
jgi:hypothetical protein